MAQGEYKGKRIQVTLDQELYSDLVLNAKQNDVQIATRAKQLIRLALSGCIQPQEQKQPVNEPIKETVIQKQEPQSQEQPKKGGQVVIDSRFKKSVKK